MANAMLLSVDDAEVFSGTTITWNITYIMVGVDAPGGFCKRSTQFTTTTSTTAAQLASAMVAAIQADAASLGATVAAGHTLIHSYVLQ